MRKIDILDVLNMKSYNHKEIEAKWQEKWEKEGIYKDYSKDKKFYALDMFPYPSGAGLHVGHPKGYIATDVVSRFKMLNGYSVIHPMGWDAFGLPAENYAIKNKVHPRKAVEENVATFKKQLEKFGFTYDWDREVNTTDPEYYKWTQWIFLQMFKKGLAFQSDEPVNWCPSCKTVLANEDLEGGVCERCGTQVVQKKLRQWVLKMTAYADRLLYELDSEDLDWEEMIKEQQRNWIGRSEGAQFKLPIVIASEAKQSKDSFIEVYTTRLDTVFGMTYAVVAPEHAIVNRIINDELRISNKQEVVDYVIKSQNKTALERTELQKEKTGVELKGIKAINPFTNEEIPLFVGDYVLGGYGTGAVMAVPAHDERDFEFAVKYGLEIRQSIAPFFTVAEGKDKPREDKKTDKRRNVFALVKHWEKDEYLCLDWEKFGWKSFIIGGIDEGETGAETAKREVAEETGYQDIKSVKKIDGEVHTYFFAEHKDVNRYGICEGYLIELGSGKFSEPAAEHTKNHKAVWVADDKIREFVNLENNLYYYEALIGGEQAYTEDGIVINSNEFSGLSSEEARGKMTKWLEEKGIGQKRVNYKMRDWVFSRQRYWGEPIPVVHCEKCGTVGVPESELPIRLPEVESYEPTGTGESPLANIADWVNTTCPDCGGPAKRETNTMPQWAGSCWYYLRYIDPKNSEALVGKDKEKEWMPVDLYVGGAEHATRHLLYARFWHKFLFDIGAVSTKEPFKKLVHVGLINAEDGRKMSKRWNNVINPDDIIERFGADSIRLYEMFMGPFTQTIAWSTNGVIGVRRFLEKVWDIYDSKSITPACNCKPGQICDGAPEGLQRMMHKTIKKVTEDIDNFRFNTAISQMMILANFMSKLESIPKTGLDYFAIILSPFAPHMAEELWSSLGNKDSIFKQSWPKYDPALVKDETFNLVVQVNGKIRETLVADADISEEDAKAKALENETVRKWIDGKEIIKVVYVKGRLVNIVIK